MTVTLGRTRIESDCCEVCAIFTGDNQWVILDLPGRTFTETAVIGLIQFADALATDGEHLLADDPLWTSAHRWLAPVGLSIWEAVGLLELPHNPCTLPPLARDRPGATARRRPSRARSVLGVLTGRPA